MGNWSYTNGYIKTMCLDADEIIGWSPPDMRKELQAIEVVSNIVSSDKYYHVPGIKRDKSSFHKKSEYTWKMYGELIEHLENTINDYPQDICFSSFYRPGLDENAYYELEFEEHENGTDTCAVITTHTTTRNYAWSPDDVIAWFKDAVGKLKAAEAYLEVQDLCTLYVLNYDPATGEFVRNDVPYDDECEENEDENEDDE